MYLKKKKYLALSQDFVGRNFQSAAGYCALDPFKEAGHGGSTNNNWGGGSSRCGERRNGTGSNKRTSMQNTSSEESRVLAAAVPLRDTRGR